MTRKTHREYGLNTDSLRTTTPIRSDPGQIR
jgi:hypothetical protein